MTENIIARKDSYGEVILLPAGKTEHPSTVVGNLTIIEAEPAPPLLKELAIEMVEGIAKKVVFGAYIKGMENCIGTYAPESKTLYIDMGNMLLKSYYYDKGMMFIPSMWFSAIYSIAHEAEHALQLEAEPTLIEFDELPQEYEDIAKKTGHEEVIKWSHKPIPPLEEMGWIGKQLVVMLNAAYPATAYMSDEPKYMAVGAVAELHTAIAHHSDYNADDTKAVQDEIDAGKMGVKIADKYFLTANELLNM